jgi:hypothetical protein
MHEVAAHPQAGELLKRFVRHTSFEPLATTGVPLATREDSRDVRRTSAPSAALRGAAKVRRTSSSPYWLTNHFSE